MIYVLTPRSFRSSLHIVLLIKVTIATKYCLTDNWHGIVEKQTFKNVQMQYDSRIFLIYLARNGYQIKRNKHFVA